MSGHTNVRKRRKKRILSESLEDRVLLSTFEVINNADSGVGSLRHAIEDTNATDGPDEIVFRLSGAGPHVIALESPLPVVTEEVVIDGWSVDEFAGTPIVVLDGTAAGDEASGLTVNGAGVTIRGLVIQNFSRHGIELNAANAVVQGNFIGVDDTGTMVAANEGNGIHISGEVTAHVIGTNADDENDEQERNVISGNHGNGIFVSGASENSIAGNRIGTSADGTSAIGNQQSGILLDNASGNNIGGASPTEQNLISGNGGNGVQVHTASEVTITGNRIGLAVDDTALGNALDGIRITSGELQGNPPVIIFTIDVSPSTANPFDGTPVGDVNDDGLSNTILDAELAGFIAFTERINALGFGSTIEIGVSVFAGNGAALDMDPSGATHLTTFAGANVDMNGEPDVIDVLKTIVVGHASTGAGTHFVDGLGSAADTFDELATPTGEGNIVFVSDGENNGGAFQTQVTRLENQGVRRFAVGMGGLARLTELRQIDENAELVESTDRFTDLLISFLGIDGQESDFGVRVGEFGPGGGNSIAFNGQDGVNVMNTLAIRNAIRGNAIFQNGDLGIDIGRNGPNTNDDKDLDAGANGLLNFPVLTSARVSNDVVEFSGNLNSIPDATLLIDAYLTPAENAPQGEIFLGSFVASTDEFGNADFSRTLSVPDVAGTYWLTLTSTDTDGNTSEFSEAREIQIPAGTFSVFDVLVSEADDHATLALSLDKPLEFDVTVDLTLTADSADAGDDFDDTPLQVTYLAGESGFKNIEVSIFQDELSEFKETFDVALSTSTNLGSAIVDFSDTAVVTIEDDDTAIFTVSDPVVSEDELMVEFTVSLANPLDINVEIAATFVDVTATGGIDYNNTPHTLLFLASTPDTQTISVGLTRDMLVEADEEFYLELNPITPLGNRSLNARDTGEARVVDNDSARVRVNNATVNEQAGTIELIADIDHPIDVDATFNILTSDLLAVAGSDYSDTISPITFPANSTESQVISIPLIADETVERVENLDVLLETGTDLGSRTVTLQNGTAIIIDDDQGEFIVDDIVISEADASAEFVVSLENAIDVDVELEISFSDVEALADIDYSAESIQFLWTAGTTGQQSFTVPVLPDELAEASETFVIILNTTTDLQARNVDLGDRAVVTIEDNDLLILVESTDGETVVSEDGLTDTILVSLNGQPQSPVAIDIGSDNTSEVRVPVARVIFTAETWNIPQSVTVAGVQDAIPDGPRTADLVFTVDEAFSDSAYQGLEPTVFSVVNNDDDLPTITINQSESETTVYENGTVDAISLQLDEQPIGTVIFDISSSDETHATVHPQTLTFTSVNWDVPQAVIVTGVDDQIDNGDASAEIAFAINPASDAQYQFVPEHSVPVTIRDRNSLFSLDVDGDGRVQSLGDGILLIRYLAGFRGEILTSGAVNPGGTRTNPSEIVSWLDTNSPFLDTDGDTSRAPLSDGILMIRYIAGFRGDPLINSAIGENSVRANADSIAGYIEPFVNPGSGGGGSASASVSNIGRSGAAISREVSALDALFGERDDLFAF